MSRTRRKNWLDTKSTPAKEFWIDWYQNWRKGRGITGRLKNHTYQPSSESVGSAVDEDQLDTWDDRGGSSSSNKGATRERRRKMKEKVRKELQELD